MFICVWGVFPAWVSAFKIRTTENSRTPLALAPSLPSLLRGPGSGLDFTVQADLKNHLGRVRVAGSGCQIERAVRGLQPAGVAAQFGEDCGQALLCPMPGESALHGMNLRGKTERPLKKLMEFHVSPVVNRRPGGFVWLNRIHRQPRPEPRRERDGVHGREDHDRLQRA